MQINALFSKFVPTLSALACTAHLAFAQTPPPAEIGADWLQDAHAGIARSEYGVTWQESAVRVDSSGVFQAPNRAQSFRTYFEPECVRLIPRTTQHGELPAWELGLSFVAWGREGALQMAELATPRATGNRVEYVRGDIVEWYVNDARGLEQGFTLAREPERGERDAFVSVHMQLSGDVTARLDEQASAVDFFAQGGARVVRFDELYVVDANGCELPAWFQLECAGAQLLSIVVDDRGASYPITIDPLALNPSWFAQGNQTSANFGFSVATAGDVNGDGYSDVIVGAYLFDNGQADEGRAFVYHGSASGLAASPAWTAESDQASAEFGVSVASAGDVDGDGYSDVIVSAWRYDNGQFDEGRAFVYHGSASGLGLSPVWTAESDQPGALFGGAVATAGDVNGDGYSDVIVGAFLYDNGQVDEGAVAGYLGSASGLAVTPAWSAESNQAAAQFGVSVATAGDVNGDGYSDVIIGANFYDNGQLDEGAAAVYLGTPGGLATTPAWSAESNQAGASLGFSVASAGDVNGDGYSDVIIGAFALDNGQVDEGQARVYQGSAVGLLSSPAWTAESNQANAYFGIAVATAGDVNGDGYADVIVGASGYDVGASTDAGRAFVYLGSVSGVSASASWWGGAFGASAFVGRSVATAGDVNGDGFSDVLVGAPGYTGFSTGEGVALAYYGDPVPAVAYCTAGTTTNGCVPSISGAGTPSASIGSGFTIDVTGVEGQKQGLIFYGVDGRIASPWGGTSFLCVKGPTQRTGTQNSAGLSGACNGAYSLDFNAYRAANPGALGQPLNAGRVVNAQAWFRDPAAAKTTNLSNALEFMLFP